jgi:non-heme chloroperoxidase
VPTDCRKLVLVDQGATATAWPGWNDEDKTVAGTIFDPQSLYATATALAGPSGIETTREFVEKGFFTSAFPQDQRDWVLAENLKFPRLYAARLIVSQCMQDWRDLIPGITLPTLVIGARASVFKPESQEWIARQIPGAQIEIFDEDEGGSHFMWLENPEKFNRIVRAFVG